MGFYWRFRNSRRLVSHKDQHLPQSSFYSSMQIWCRVHLGTAALWLLLTTIQHGSSAHRQKITHELSRTRSYQCLRSGNVPALLGSKQRRHPLSISPDIKKQAETLPHHSDSKRRKSHQWKKSRF